MAKYIIKESEIRNYVRCLIRESIEAEGLTPQDDEKYYNNFMGYINNGGRLNKRTIDSFGHTFPELTKMVNGKGYNRSDWSDWRNASTFPAAVERHYRRMMGYAPFAKKSLNGVTPYLIDSNGNDISPENSEKGREVRAQQKVDDHRKKEANKFVRKDNIESWAKAQGMSDEEIAELIASGKPVKDKNANLHSGNNDLAKALQDPNFAKWFNMSDEEKEAERERIRRERVQQNLDRNAGLIRQLNDLARRGVVNPTKEELEQKIKNLKAKLNALEDNDLNRDARNRYAHIIRDTQRIIDRFYNDGGSINPKDDKDDVDDIVKGALNNIDNDDRFKGLAAENGLEEIDPSRFETDYEEEHTKTPKENNTEEPHSAIDLNQRRDFDDAKEMGMFGDDEDFLF